MAARRRRTSGAGRVIVRAVVVAMLLVVASGLATDPGGRPAGAAGFAAGDEVEVATDFLNLRTGAGLSKRVIDVLAEGTWLTITGGPKAAGGYDWYEVETAGGGAGWVAGEYLAYSSAGDGGGFDVGDTAVVAAPQLNCRSGPGLDFEVIYVMDGGDEVEILGGPRPADGYHWYRIRTDDGDVGWAIGEALVLADDDGGDGGDGFAKGAAVVVNTDFLNLRGAAGLGRPVLAILPYGTALIVSNGPMTAGGYAWYEVETLDGRLGWVVGEYLALPGEAGDGFAVGDAVRVVDGALNLRARPNPSATVVRVLADGELLLIEGGPVEAGGRVWYHVWNFGGEGWAAGAFLVFEPAGFPIEDGG